MKRLIDKNGRLFGLISVIDVIVVVVVAVLVVALYVKDRNPHTGSAVTTVPITMVIEIEAAQGFVAEAVRVGDTLYDKDQATGGAIGTITDVQVLPGTLKTMLTDGTFREIPVDESNNIVITVEGTGLINEKGYFSINKIYYVGVNASRNFYTKYASFTGSFLDVRA